MTARGQTSGASRDADPRLVSWLQWLSRGSAVVAALMGFVVLLGWAYDVELLEGPGRQHVTTNPTTALAVMLAAASLWIQHAVWRRSSTSRAVRAVAGIAAVVVVAVGATTLVGYLIGRNVGYYEDLIFQSLPVGRAPALDDGGPVGG